MLGERGPPCTDGVLWSNWTWSEAYSVTLQSRWTLSAWRRQIREERFSSSPRVSLYFDIFTASLNRLYLCTFSLSHVLIAQRCLLSLSMKLFTFAGWDYFCRVEWMMLFFVSEWVRRKCCRLRNNVPCSPTHLERLVLAAKAEENHVHFLSRKLVKVH